MGRLTTENADQPSCTPLETNEAHLHSSRVLLVSIQVSERLQIRATERISSNARKTRISGFGRADTP